MSLRLPPLDKDSDLDRKALRAYLKGQKRLRHLEHKMNALALIIRQKGPYDCELDENANQRIKGTPTRSTRVG